MADAIPILKGPLRLVPLLIVIVPLLIIGWALFFNGSHENNDFQGKFARAASLFAREYGLPVYQSGSKVTTACEYVHPDPSIADCDTYVKELKERNPALAATIQNIQSLLQDIPPGEAAPTGLMQEMVDLLNLAYRSNLRLIEGWTERDSSKWDEGWRLRHELQSQGKELLARLQKTIAANQ